MALSLAAVAVVDLSKVLVYFLKKPLIVLTVVPKGEVLKQL